MDKESSKPTYNDNIHTCQEELIFLYQVLDNINGILFTHDPEGNLVFANKKFMEFTGFNKDQLMRSNFLDLVQREDRDEARKQMAISQAGKPGTYEARVIIYGNEIRKVRFNVSPLWEKQSVVGGIVLAEDVTDYRKKEKALQESRQFLLDIINFLPDPTFVIDMDGRVIIWNKAIEEMTGVKAADILGKNKYEHAIPFYGKRRPILIDLLFKSEEEVKQYYSYVKRENDTLMVETSFPCVKGKQRTLWGKATPLYNSEGEMIAAIETIRDITERKRTEDKMKYLIYHDSLTGLNNRAFFEQEIKRLENSRNNPVGIIVCDIDGLKLVNDTMGHQAGDEMLINTAKILRQSFRDDDIITRIGGDEFAVLLPGTSEKVVKDATCRLKETLRRYNEKGEGIPLSLSFGWAVREDSGQNLSEVFKTADNRMYENKPKKRADFRRQIEKWKQNKNI